MAYIEDVSRRKRQAKCYYNDTDLTKGRVIITAHDQHYLDDALVWQDVDESFINETGTFTHQCVKTCHAIHIATTSRKRWAPRRDHPTEYIDFGRLQYWTGSAWTNLNLGTPVRSANTLTWDTSNFTLKLIHIWRCVKILVTLKNSNAAKRLRWAVTLSGLTWNNWALISNSDATMVGMVRKPRAWDANGSERKPNLTITPSYSGGYVEFTGDLSAAVYPVTIDPTLDITPDATAGIDALIYQDAPTTNYGTYASMEVGHYDAEAGGIERELMKFDASSIPGGSTIDDATLSLYVSNLVGSAQTIKLYNILAGNSGWTEAGATWNHAVENTVEWAGSVGCGTAGTDYSNTELASEVTFTDDATHDFILSTTQVALWLTANYGFIIKEATEPNSQWVQFGSSDGGASARPHLVINYTEGGAGPQTVTLNALSLAGSVPQAAVVPGAVTITAAALTLAGSVPQASIVSTVSVILSALSLAGSAPQLSVVPGSTTVTLSALELAGSAPTLASVGGAITVTLNALTLAGSIPALQALPGSVSILLDALGLTGSVPQASIVPGGVTVGLNALDLTGSVPQAEVTTGAFNQTITLSALVLQALVVHLYRKSKHRIGFPFPPF